MGDRRSSSKKAIIEISDSDSETPKVGSAKKRGLRFMSLGNHEAESHQEIQEVPLTEEQFKKWKAYTDKFEACRKGHQDNATAEKTAGEAFPEGYEIDNDLRDKLSKMEKYQRSHLICSFRATEQNESSDQARKKHPLGYIARRAEFNKIYHRGGSSSQTETIEDEWTQIDNRSIPGVDAKEHNKRIKAYYDGFDV